MWQAGLLVLPCFLTYSIKGYVPLARNSPFSVENNYLMTCFKSKLTKGLERNIFFNEK